MKFISRFFIVLTTTLLTISSAFADNKCISNTSGVDVCMLARALADEMASMLPMKLNQNITIDRAYAFGHKLTVTAILGYEKKYLDDLMESSGTSPEQLKEKLAMATKANICQDKAVLKFLEYGGKLGYVYNFSDFMPFYKFEINTCNQ